MLLLNWKGFTEFDLKKTKPHRLYGIDAPVLPYKGIIGNRLDYYFCRCIEKLGSLDYKDIIKISDDIRDYFSFAKELIFNGHTGELVIDEFPGYGSLSHFSHGLVLSWILDEYFGKEDVPENYYYVLSIMLINEAYRLTGDDSVIAALDAITAFHFASSPGEVKSALSERAKKAANVRHAKQKVMVEFTHQLARAIRVANKKISSRKIAEKIAYAVIQKADSIGYRYSKERINQTIYDWVLRGNSRK